MSAGEAATYLGLYTATDIVDEDFLQARFGNHDGFLMKPTLATFMNRGYWPQRVKDLNAKTKPRVTESDKMLTFLKLINEQSARAFNDEIASFMDLDDFLRLAVVNGASELRQLLLYGQELLPLSQLSDEEAHLDSLGLRPLLRWPLPFRYTRAADLHDHRQADR
jgi:hypothetical protein